MPYDPRLNSKRELRCEFGKLARLEFRKIVDLRRRQSRWRALAHFEGGLCKCRGLARLGVTDEQLISATQ